MSMPVALPSPAFHAKSWLAGPTLATRRTHESGLASSSPRQCRHALPTHAPQKPVSCLPTDESASGTSMAQGSHDQQDQHAELADHRGVLTLTIACYQEELFSHPHVLSYVAARTV